jgi:hypothetical protein
MPEISLDRACVVAVVGELVPAGVPQHVGMNLEPKPWLRRRRGLAASRCHRAEVDFNEACRSASRACVLDDVGVGLLQKPAYRRRIDAEGSRHVHKRFAIRKPLDRFLALMLVKLARPAESPPWLYPAHPPLDGLRR